MLTSYSKSRSYHINQGLEKHEAPRGRFVCLFVCLLFIFLFSLGFARTYTISLPYPTLTTVLPYPSLPYHTNPPIPIPPIPPFPIIPPTKKEEKKKITKEKKELAKTNNKKEN